MWVTDIPYMDPMGYVTNRTDFNGKKRRSHSTFEARAISVRRLSEKFWRGKKRETPRSNDKWGITTKKYTLPETNVAPENRQSQKETSIPSIHFQGLC